ncbi:MAG TPA: hypothetical protein VLG36_06010 [Candidatus Chromulinivoraceae bacterium]|nr:hypothetical protein [Candidatus Chromulinivoraceae bacterium]
MASFKLFFNAPATTFAHLFKHSRKWYIIICSGGIAGLFIMFVVYQNIHAELSLQSARHSDDKGQLGTAQSTLNSTNHLLVLPSLVSGLNTEQARNKQLISKQHTEGGVNSSPTTQISSSDKGSATPQKTTPQQAINKGGTTKGNASTSKLGGSGTSSSTGSGTGGSGGTTGGNTTPPPGPMGHISASLSVTTSAYTASQCSINQTVHFSVDGSGSVSVTWKVLSNRTSDSVYNPVTYSFSAAGSNSDNVIAGWQGLEPGDSYRISAVVTDTADSSITTTAGPFVVSSCAAPQQLMVANGTSYMTHITPGTISSSQYHDSIFSNECSMSFQEPFSVDGAGSVQAVYVITSGSSGGATLYGNTRHDFPGASSDTDTSYIRMPHLNNGDSYTINVALYDLANHSIVGTAGPITSGCS